MLIAVSGVAAFGLQALWVVILLAVFGAWEMVRRKIERKDD